MLGGKGEDQFLRLKGIYNLCPGQPQAGKIIGIGGRGEVRGHRPSTVGGNHSP